MEKKLLTPEECPKILDRISNNLTCMIGNVETIISTAAARKKIIDNINSQNTKYLKKMKDK